MFGISVQYTDGSSHEFIKAYFDDYSSAAIFIDRMEESLPESLQRPELGMVRLKESLLDSMSDRENVTIDSGFYRYVVRHC